VPVVGPLGELVEPSGGDDVDGTAVVTAHEGDQTGQVAHSLFSLVTRRVGVVFVACSRGVSVRRCRTLAVRVR